MAEEATTETEETQVDAPAATEEKPESDTAEQGEIAQLRQQVTELVTLVKGQNTGQQEDAALYSQDHINKLYDELGLNQDVPTKEEERDLTLEELAAKTKTIEASMEKMRTAFQQGETRRQVADARAKYADFKQYEQAMLKLHEQLQGRASVEQLYQLAKSAAPAGAEQKAQPNQKTALAAAQAASSEKPTGARTATKPVDAPDLTLREAIEQTGKDLKLRQFNE